MTALHSNLYEHFLYVYIDCRGIELDLWLACSAVVMLLKPGLVITD